MMSPAHSSHVARILLLALPLTLALAGASVPVFAAGLPAGAPPQAVEPNTAASAPVRRSAPRGVARTATPAHCQAVLRNVNHPDFAACMVAAYRATFDKVATMKADVFLANHENFFDLHAKRDRQKAGDANAFVNPDELQAFNTNMKAAFEKELASQTAAAAKQHPR